MQITTDDTESLIKELKDKKQQRICELKGIKKRYISKRDRLIWYLIIGLPAAIVIGILVFLDNESENVLLDTLYEYTFQLIYRVMFLALVVFLIISIIKLILLVENSTIFRILHINYRELKSYIERTQMEIYRIEDEIDELEYNHVTDELKK